MNKIILYSILLVKLLIAQQDTNFVQTQINNFSYTSNSITLNTKQLSNYKFIGDIIPSKKNCFIRDLGNFGQPYDFTLYGLPQPYTGILIDGLDYSSPLTKGFDLYNLQSTNISSIEIIEPYKAFLFSLDNNLSTININQKYQIPEKPTTTIKYIQSSGEDAFLETSFASRINEYFTFNFNLKTQNNESDNSIIKNSSNIWNLNPVFIFSPNYNNQFILSYNYNQTKRELNGGVDIEKLYPLLLINQFHTIFYDKNLAPVIYNNLNYTNYFNSIKLNHIYDNHLNFKISSSILYLSDNDKFDYKSSNVSTKFNKFLFSSDIRYDFEGFEIFSKINYQKNDIKSNSIPANEIYTLSLNLNKELNNFAFNVYAKTFYKEKFYNSMGSDFSFNHNLFKTTFGLSLVNSPYIKNYFYNNAKLISITDYTIKSYNYYTSLTFKINKFYNNLEISFSDINNYTYLHQPTNKIKVDSINIKNGKLENLSFKYFTQLIIYKFQIENNLVYNFQKLDNKSISVIPKFYNKLNISYNDIAYNVRLNYKIGFEFNYSTKTDFVYYDYLNRETIFSGYENIFLKSDPKLIINGYLNANLINKFNIFFVWENLLNYNYTITPNYPIYGTNYRLGINWILDN
ncbi:MAG TPA: hypothetical protein PK591_04880 [Ignavibacteriales bacterium]|nr:hypothetical protein [Ignavibacteriales bacterium]